MKKKGFTLIELIVVIAIIGVLAAILVPAMLGYVKKSKVTTANTTAKSIYNALNSSLTDMDSEDKKIKDLGSSDYSSQSGSVWAQDSTYSGSSLINVLHKKVYGYFSDIAKVQEFAFTIDAGGACVAAAAMNGAYPGSYPKAMTVDDYNTGSYSTAQAALGFAKG